MKVFLIAISLILIISFCGIFIVLENAGYYFDFKDWCWRNYP